MKKLLILLTGLFFLGTGTISAQQNTPVQIDPGNPAFQESYRHFDFKGQFASLVLEDTENNYFLVDFSKLPGKYEKVCFMNLSFGEGKIVNIDSDLSHDKIWFLSNKKYEAADILKIFSSLKAKTDLSSQTLTGEQKSAWLKANDKYK
jgi:hypothetical protein